MAIVSRTLSREIVSAVEGAAPHLFLLLVCDSPGIPSLRLSLHGIEALSIGRGELQRGQLLRTTEGASLTVPDGRMSVAHATLRRVMASWILSDERSRNGTFVNGRRIERHVLEDGDLVEMGHSFLMFRSAVAVVPADLALLYSDDVPPPAAGLETLVPSLAADFRRAEAVARSQIPVVIRGETGTGKEVVAAALHALSGRPGRFVAVDCRSLSPTLVHSQLFGHRKGAFAGATEDVSGLVRDADHGTLFLDAVEELPAAAQPLLSRVLEQAQVAPLGSAHPVGVDLRVIAATQQDLEALAASDRFRGDLVARLSGLTLDLPPLRERREDLGLLIRALLKRYAAAGAPQPALTCDAARALLLHRWPRNVRELDRALQAALVLAEREPIGLRHLPAHLRKPAADGGQEAKPSFEAPVPLAMKVQHFVDELWRRHVVRVLVAYSVAVFGALQGADVIVTRLSLPPQWMTWIVVASLAGFPVAGVLAWVFDWTKQGIVRTPAISGAQRRKLARERPTRRQAIAFAGWILFLVTAAGVIWWRTRHT